MDGEKDLYTEVYIRKNTAKQMITKSADNKILYVEEMRAKFVNLFQIIFVK